MEMPPNMEAQIRPRSGLAIKYPNYLVNSPGTVDADYRGQIHILFVNNTKEPIVISHGQRMAQMIISKVEKLTIIETDKLSNTERGDGGYGHTGI
jgi:dUTP pyrophosphatase